MHPLALPSHPPVLQSARQLHSHHWCADVRPVPSWRVQQRVCRHGLHTLWAWAGERGADQRAVLLGGQGAAEHTTLGWSAQQWNSLLDGKAQMPSCQPARLQPPPNLVPSICPLPAACHLKWLQEVLPPPPVPQITINSGLGATQCSPCPRGTFKPSGLSINRCSRWERARHNLEAATTQELLPLRNSVVGGQPCNASVGSSPKLSQLSHPMLARAPPDRRPSPAHPCLPLHHSCPSGYETRVNGTGASSCTMCRPGFFASNPNTAFCEPCAPATFAPAPGSKACKLCAAGEVTGPLPGDARIGGAGMNASFCTPCGRRTFRPSIYAANTCIRCPAGRETRRAQGASTCTACIPGSTLLSPSDFACTSCSAGAWAGAGLRGR